MEVLFRRGSRRSLVMSANFLLLLQPRMQKQETKCHNNEVRLDGQGIMIKMRVQVVRFLPQESWAC